MGMWDESNALGYGAPFRLLEKLLFKLWGHRPLWRMLIATSMRSTVFRLSGPQMSRISRACPRPCGISCTSLCCAFCWKQTSLRSVCDFISSLTTGEKLGSSLSLAISPSGNSHLVELLLTVHSRGGRDVRACWAERHSPWGGWSEASCLRASVLNFSSWTN